MALPSPSDYLTPELVVKTWGFLAALNHAAACRRGADCSGQEVCLESRSPDPAVAFVSKRWNEIATRNPKLFSYIRVQADVGFPTERHLTSIPVYNAPEVKACIALSGSEDIHLSIGCSRSPQPPTADLTLGALATRASSLVLDTDHARILFLATNASFPRLKTIHLIHSPQRDLYTNSSALIEDFRLWSDSPLENIICGHWKSSVLRTKVSWSTIKLLDIYGADPGFREADVEAILHCGTHLEELRVGVYADSTNLGIPNTLWFASGKRLGGLVHKRLKTLFIRHTVGRRSSVSPPPHPLFEGMEFEVLESLNYSCTNYPSDNSVKWLRKDRPTVRSLALDAHYISPMVLNSILPAFGCIQKLRLEVQSMSDVEYGLRPFDALDVLRNVRPGLQILFLDGEGCFTTDALARFGKYAPSFGVVPSTDFKFLPS